MGPNIYVSHCILMSYQTGSLPQKPLHHRDPHIITPGSFCDTNCHPTPQDFLNPVLSTNHQIPISWEHSLAGSEIIQSYLETPGLDTSVDSAIRDPTQSPVSRSSPLGLTSKNPSPPSLASLSRPPGFRTPLSLPFSRHWQVSESPLPGPG